MDGEAANKRRRPEPNPHPASLDFISSLPDDMLLVIIGLLATKSAMRTALLLLGNIVISKISYAHARSW